MPEDRPDDVERSARQGLDAKGGAELARALLRSERAAVLATTLASAGQPFASLVPFALSREGEPLLLLSDLAQHTRNLAADPRACLFVHDADAAAKDPRTAARAAILGRVKRVAPGDEQDARERYLARHPTARGLMNLDFAPYVLAIEEAQIVAGFAAAGWVSGAELRKAER
jgi:putative heme iron utilization protein